MQRLRNLGFSRIGFISYSAAPSLSITGAIEQYLAPEGLPSTVKPYFSKHALGIG